MKRQKHIFVWMACGLVLVAYSAPSIVNCKLSNCKWYDLSGRQIRHSSLDTRRLPHGNYIRDGKKVCGYTEPRNYGITNLRNNGRMANEEIQSIITL